jgi:hypothetical protein
MGANTHYSIGRIVDVGSHSHLPLLISETSHKRISEFSLK